MKWTGTLDIDKARATTNRIGGTHWTDRAANVRQIRGDFALLTSKAGNKAPRFKNPVVVEVQIECRPGGRAKPLDTDAGYAAAKAAVDGLRDAYVLVEDTGEYVKWIRHHAPVWSPDDRDAITLTVESAPTLFGIAVGDGLDTERAEASTAAMVLRKLLGRDPDALVGLPLGADEIVLVNEIIKTNERGDRHADS